MRYGNFTTNAIYIEMIL